MNRMPDYDYANGYAGESFRSQAAREKGLITAAALAKQLSKALGVRILKADVEAGETPAEWHHSGSDFRTVNFYDPADINQDRSDLLYEFRKVIQAANHRLLEVQFAELAKRSCPNCEKGSQAKWGCPWCGKGVPVPGVTVDSEGKVGDSRPMPLQTLLTEIGNL